MQITATSAGYYFIKRSLNNLRLERKKQRGRTGSSGDGGGLELQPHAQAGGGG